jgi:hypothetical protein
MANNPAYPPSVKQPKPKVVDNKPASSVSQSLAQNKAQVDKSK